MRGMYNSSMWDSTEGQLLYPSEPPETHQRCFGLNAMLDAVADEKNPESQDRSVEAVSGGGDCKADRRPRGFTRQRGAVIKCDRKQGEKDQIVTAAEQKTETC